jgi:hypothetical protein
MDQVVQPSLHRNGRVLMRRNQMGSDTPMEGLVVEKRDVPLVDARKAAPDEQPTLYRNGFELQHSPLGPDAMDFMDHESVIRTYYPTCEQLIQQATGAARVCAFDHNVRSAAGKKEGARISGGQEVQGPARMVHGDYTLTSAPQRLRDLTEPPGPNDTLMAVLGADKSLFERREIENILDSGNFAIINVWRSIADEPVQTDPLALCDGQTVEPEDLVVFEIHYDDRIGENYFARASDKHRWFFYPGMSRDEALLIKQWDSRGPLANTEGDQPDHTDADAPCTFSFHSAFKNRSASPDAPSRWSIEVRCIALFPPA